MQTQSTSPGDQCDDDECEWCTQLLLKKYSIIAKKGLKKQEKFQLNRNIM